MGTTARYPVALWTVHMTFIQDALTGQANKKKEAKDLFYLHDSHPTSQPHSLFLLPDIHDTTVLLLLSLFQFID